MEGVKLSEPEYPKGVKLAEVEFAEGVKLAEPDLLIACVSLMYLVFNIFIYLPAEQLTGILQLLTVPCS